MGTLFNRPCPEKLAEPLRRLRQSANARDRAIGDNFAIEPNVCNARAEAWVKDWKEGEDLDRHIKSFQEKRIAAAKEPDFLNTSYHRVQPDSPPARLAICLDMTRLHQVLVLATREFKLDYFLDRVGGYKDPYPASSSPETHPAIFEWHNKRCASGPEAQRHTTQIIHALNNQIREGRPRHPVWTTTWETFIADASNDSPAGWLYRLGIVREPRKARRWLAMVVYDLPEVASLLLPTSIDAGEHFMFHPPPPACRAGHPVRLESGGDHLHVEFIHKQVEMPDKFEVKWVGHTPELDKEPTGEEYESWRATHRQRLIRHYKEGAGKDTLDWLNALRQQ